MMTRSLTRASALWVALWMTTACGNSANLESQRVSSRGMEVGEGFVPADAPARAASPAGAAGVSKLDTSPDPGPRAADEPVARMRIYSGTLTVLVPNVDDAVKRAIALVESEGGFLQSRDGGTLHLRVLAAKYASTMTALEKFGKVTRRAEQTEDVTRQYHDLNIRLENARESRQRLVELLAKATEVKAILEIEQELRRLTDEIERFEMELRNLEHQVAFSRIECWFTAEVHAPPPRPRSGLFPWFDSLGVDSMLRDFADVRPAIRPWYDFFGGDDPTPNGFVPVASSAGEAHAVAADESLYRTTSREESPQGDVSFWAGAIAADFEQRRGYVVTGNRRVEIDGRPGCELIAETPGDGRGRRYLLLLAVDDGDFSDTLSITEYVALPDRFDDHLAALRETANVKASPAQ